MKKFDHRRYYSIVLVMALFMTNCLITEVDQSTEVNSGDTFTATITVTDMTADANANTGAIAVLVPDDWEFDSGTYVTAGGTGDLIIDTAAAPLYGDLEGLLPPPTDMKWIRLLTDAAYVNDADATHEATINLTVGEKQGEFNIGYMVTKNSVDLLTAETINLTETDNGNAWADTCMTNPVSVNMSTDVEDETAIVTDYKLNQNYPNPFNPSTNISFVLPSATNVKITVYDAIGNEVEVIRSGYMNAGQNTVKFNAQGLSSGIYMYKLEADNFIAFRKMLLMK